MFSRDKKRVEPAGRPKSGRKGKKAAWESLLSTQEKQAALEEKSRQNGHVAHFRPQRQRETPELNEYDHFNTSGSPNSSLSLSGSFPKGFESLWKSSQKSNGRLNSSFEGKWPKRNEEEEDALETSFEGRLSRSGHSFNSSFDHTWPRRSGSKSSLNSSTDVDKEFVLSATHPPVKRNLVAKIQAGKYINFQELLAENLVKETRKNKNLDETEKIDDITKWIECVGLYIAICSLVNVYHVQNLIAYQSTILHLYRESRDPRAWQRYDVAFRRKASLNGVIDWSNIDESLWVLASSPEARKPVLCEPCLSMMHDSHSCPLRAMPEEHSRNRAMWPPAKSPQRDNVRSRSVSPSCGDRRPQEGLELEFVFGYHGYNACNNLFYTQSNEMAFHIASLGVVYNPHSHQQRFYKGHTDDILCLTIHDTKDFVATGQVGKRPETHVWDAITMRTVSVLKGFHRRGIICVDFSGDGKKLVDIGLDDDHSICIWDWQKQEKLASTRGHKDMIFVIEWNPFNNNYLVSVGEKHIKFWTHNGAKIDKRPVTFGKAGTAATMLCVCHSPIDDLCFAGSDTGEVYVWQGTTLRRKAKAHKGAVTAMYSLCQYKEEGYVTGGRDGVVVMWDKYFEECLKAFKVEQAAMNRGSVLLQDLPPIRSIHTDEGRILIGTGHDEIIEISENGKMTIVVQGHGEGEVWGLDTHPCDDECVTVSDDKTLRVWDLKYLRLKKVKKLKKGGRAVAYSPDGVSLAVGQNDGGFLILDAETLEKVVGFHDRKEEISDIKFSPDSKFLAVGSHDNFVDIYSVKRGKRIGICKGSSSYITHVDWDVQGKLLQTNSGAREHLFYEVPGCVRKTISAPVIERVDWATFTGVLGPAAKGIFPPNSDITDVNATCRTRDYSLLASGDDFGAVKIFDYPVVNRNARFCQYGGHSSHVTNVRWTHDDRRLVSTGGLDTAVIVWERITVHPDESVSVAEEKTLVQPKFIPAGSIKSPIAKGKTFIE